MGRFSTWLAAAIIGLAGPAAAETLVLGNCTEPQITVKTYNQNDDLCWLPRNTTYIGGCTAATVECEGGCKVVIDNDLGCPSETHSGKNIYTKQDFVTDAQSLLGQPGTIYFNYCQCPPAAMREAMGM